MGLQKFSNIKLSLLGVQPLLQQLNHILKVKEIKIRPQATPVNIIMGENDRLIDPEQMEKFSLYFTNLNISILEGESHILNMNKVYDILTLFLTKKSYGSVNN